MDSWAGIGHVAVGMYRQGYGLKMTRYDERGSRATFYTTGMEHLPTSATGTGWQRTPWHVTQRAAWGVVRQERPGGQHDRRRRPVAPTHRDARRRQRALADDARRWCRVGTAVRAGHRPSGARVGTRGGRAVRGLVRRSRRELPLFRREGPGLRQPGGGRRGGEGRGPDQGKRAVLPSGGRRVPACSGGQDVA